MGKIISITALYRFDCDNGLRITLGTDTSHMEEGDLEVILQVMIMGYDQLWKDAVAQFKDQKLIDVFHRRLANIGKRKTKTHKLETVVAIIGAVWLMQREGYLRNDSYNGIQLEFSPIN